MKASGFSTWKSYIILAQIPFYSAIFMGLRATTHLDPTTGTGGILWFHNLAALDPLGRLGLIYGVLSLINIQVLHSLRITPLVDAIQTRYSNDSFH